MGIAQQVVRAKIEVSAEAHCFSEIELSLRTFIC